MQIASYTYRKKDFSTWLLSVTFLLGLTLFSGYTGKSTARYQQPVQTAWNYTNNNKNAPRATSYKRAAATLYKTYAINNASAYKVALRVYNKCIQIKLADSRSIFNAVKSAQRIARLKLIPGHADEDPLVSIAG